MRVIIDDQQNAVAFVDLAAVIGYHFLRVRDCARRRGRLLDWRNARYEVRNGASGATIHKRQVQGERTSLSGGTLQLDFPTQQYCKLAADGEAQTRPTVFTAGSGVRLLERLEDQLLL